VAGDQRRKLIPIGRFARLSSLTPRQLRYYHALGLLLPAAVDPDSGYRYYAQAQRATAELIALLRSVDMPLPDIQSMLADRSTANVRAAFDRLRTTVEERLARARDILDRLDSPALEDTVMEQEAAATYPYAAFTEESREVLLLAQRLAEEGGDRWVGTEHMLAALAGESAGATGRALRPLGVDATAVMSVVDAIRAERGGREPASGPPLPNAAIRDVIAQSFVSAGVDPSAAGDQVIDTANLLSCTLRARDDEGGAAMVLRRLDITGAEVLARLR
jgi:DNA-binding transcriptional MerR regulator